MKIRLRWLVSLGLVMVLAGLLISALIRIGPRNVWGMLRYDTRREGGLRIGDDAPDVVLTDLDGTTAVHLKQAMGARPLVLIFGSYT